MKFYLYFFSTLMCSNLLVAQMSGATSVTTAKTFNTADVYVAPSSEAVKIDRLPSNRLVNVVVPEFLPESKTWTSITYTKNKKKYKGYIRTADVAQKVKTKGNYLIMLGYGSFPTDGSYIPENSLPERIKVFDAGKVIAESNFFLPSINNLEKAIFSIEGNHNLKNVLFSLKITVKNDHTMPVMYEQIVLFTNNKKLILLPYLKNYAENSSFSYQQKFEFPSKLSNTTATIIKKTEVVNNNNDDGTQENTSSEIIYKWNGNTLSKN